MADPRFAGSNDDGQVRAAVDGTGRLVELALEPALLRRPAWVVADEILIAVRRAQSEAPPPGAAGGGDVPLDLSQVEQQIDAINAEADRQLAEFRAIVADLVRPRESGR